MNLFLAKVHIHSCLNSQWFNSSLQVPLAPIKLDGCRPINLHDLSSLSSYRIVAKDFPFETALGQSCFHIWISLDLPSSFVLEMEDLCSDILAVNICPDELHYQVDRLRKVREVERADVPKIPPKFILGHMVDVE